MSTNNQLEQAKNNLTIAEQLKEAGKIAEAVEYYQKALEVDKENLQGWRKLGELYEGEKQWEKVINCYQKIAEIDKNAAWAYQKIGNIFLYRLQQPRDAIVNYRKGLATQPESFWLNKNFAEALLEDERPKQAIEACGKALELDGENPEVYVILARAYFKLKNYQVALENYNRAIELNPEEAKKLEKEITQCQELLTANPQSVNQTPIEVKQEKVPAPPVEVREEKIEVKPAIAEVKVESGGDFQIYENRGDACKKEGKLDESIANYLKAQELAPERPKIYVKLGNIFKQKQDINQAISNYKKAIDLNSKDPWIYENLGDILKDQGNLEEAALNYNQALELEQEKPLLYCKIANIFKALGRLKQAVKNYQKAVELGLKDRFIYESLADTLRDQGNLEEAIINYNLALELETKKPWLYVKAGDVCQQLSDYQEAVKKYQQALALNPEKREQIEKSLALCQQMLQKGGKTAKVSTPQSQKALTIAIATDCHNQGQFLETSVESIQGQNYPHLDYLIIDGGSIDNSLEVIKTLGNPLQIEPNLGRYQALNRAFSQSNAEIMGWIKPTDTLLPGTLNLVAQIFRDLPEVNWITSQFTLNSDMKGTIVRGFFISGFNTLDFQNSDNLILEKIFATNIQQGCSFWRRSLWEKVGAHFNTDFELAADFELWCRFFRYTELFAVNAPLVVQKENINLLENAQYWQEVQQICENYGMAIPNKSMIKEREILLSHTPSREVKYIVYNQQKQRFEISYL
jgi:tetratricopeptide (TPR) repeat protein